MFNKTSLAATTAAFLLFVVSANAQESNSSNPASTQGVKFNTAKIGSTPTPPPSAVSQVQKTTLVPAIQNTQKVSSTVNQPAPATTPQVQKTISAQAAPIVNTTAKTIAATSPVTTVPASNGVGSVRPAPVAAAPDVNHFPVRQEPLSVQELQRSYPNKVITILPNGRILTRPVEDRSNVQDKPNAAESPANSKRVIDLSKQTKFPANPKQAVEGEKKSEVLKNKYETPKKKYTFYAGVDGNYSRIDHRNKDMINPNSKYNQAGLAKVSSNGFGAGINAGVKQYFGKIFVGPEVFYDYLNNESKGHFYMRFPSQTRSDTIIIDHRYGLKVNLGYNLYKNIDVFVNAGMTRTHYTHRLYSVRVAKGYSAYEVSPIFGFGLAYNLDEHLTLKLSYDFQRVDTKYVNEGERSIAYTHVTKLGVAYNF